MSLFLTPEERRELTGFATKVKQIEQLRKMGVPFFVNGAGWPIVTVAAIEGRKEEPQAKPGWQPRVLQGIR